MMLYSMTQEDFCLDVLNTMYTIHGFKRFNYEKTTVSNFCE